MHDCIPTDERSRLRPRLIAPDDDIWVEELTDGVHLASIPGLKKGSHHLHVLLRHGLLLETEVGEGRRYIGVAGDHTNDFAALDLVGVGHADVNGQVAALAHAMPAHVAHHPGMRIDVLVDLRLELVVDSSRTSRTSRRAPAGRGDRAWFIRF